ncbi:MAG: sulfatase-like hydrolase/transferase [Planctomycetes bacterium]|nr:sulfatase-like hydrolase/transferase [Planctomycetota bacterium]MCP4771169.1 sulfatase-like hydrolase/transferase [Planctomycetota bacterium]MCP4862104.1 sulfatase-like hydrolase/transferase [Planctomycetota bacterium]
MKSIASAVLGTVLSGLILAAFGLGWEQELPMWRERLFSVALNGIFAGWLAGLIAHFLGGKSAGRALILGIAFGVAPWSFFTLGFAIAIAAVFWKRELAVPKAVPMLGWVAHLAPAIVFFGMSPSWTIIPTVPAPPLSAADDSAPLPAAGTADVLFVVCDTLRADSILDPNIPTPVMDDLRARGVWADYATAPANQTLPSHLSLLTGFEIEKIGMRGNLSSWPSRELIMGTFECNPLAQRFAQAGYRTAAVGTNTLLTDIPPGEAAPGKPSTFMPFDIGFQTWYGLTAVDYWKTYMDWTRSKTLMGLILPKRALSWPFGHLLNPADRRTYRHHHLEGERTTDSAIKYITELQQDERPYFFFAQYFDPHTPYAPPKELAGSLREGVPLPEGFGSDPTSVFNMRVSLRDDIRGQDEELHEDLPRGNYLQAIYNDEVAYFDQQLGRLIEAVESAGRPTIIAFTSDHGEGFGLHGNVEHGESLYEAEIAVPFILVAPGLEPRKLDFAPRMLDNARTMLSLAGVDATRFDGVDVLAEDAVPQPAMSFMIDHVSMIEGEWKLHASLRYSYDRDDPEAGPEKGLYELKPLRLFHLKTDPKEANDVLAANPEIVKQLVAQIDLRMETDALPAIGRRFLSASEMAQLAEVGYADGPEDSH